MITIRRIVLLALVALSAMPVPPASAQDSEKALHGKTVRMIVGSGVGGRTASSRG